MIDTTILNFTCIEKKKTLEDRTCNQTIRTSIDKFFKDKGVLRYRPTQYTKCSIDTQENYGILRPLHIWWNARNFHVEDICECGCLRGEHRPHCANFKKFDAITQKWGWCDEFKLAKQGLGPKKFLGMGEITSIVRKKVVEITEEDARNDGFTTKEIGRSTGGIMLYDSARKQLIEWLLSHNKNLTLDSYVYVITWRWL